jgi:nucleoside 2-deoxyribosyltransferase
MRAVVHRPTVYLAGPTVFEPDPDAAFAEMKRICARHALEGVSPLDGQVALEGVPPGAGLARRIVQADIALMRRVDGGIFCLDGFRRGPEMDPGTAFEVGYMHGLGKKLGGWTRDARDYPTRVRDYFAGVFGLTLDAGLSGGSFARSGALRDPDGMLVHSEGCVQNAMVHVGIEMDGGFVCADADWRRAFEAAIAHLAPRLCAQREPRGPRSPEAPS